MKIITIKPTQKGTQEQQLQNCLFRLEERLSGMGLEVDRLLKISVFFHPDHSGDYLQQRNNLQKVLTNYFGEQYPSYSVISDFPDDDCAVSLEAYTAPDTCALHQKTFRGHRYVVLENGYKKELYVSGITMDDQTEGTAISDHAEYVFSVASQLLEQEGMNYSHVVRIWNYIENITGIFTEESGTYQNYQVFNDVRTCWYNRYDFKNGYPSSTGIGMYKGGIVMEFIAVSSALNQILPVKNMFQTDACLYPDKVLAGSPCKGLTKISTPKFERGMLIEEQNSRTLFISGTASIVNEKTIGPRNIRKQVETTLDHIHFLFGNCQRNIPDNQQENDLYFRVYVRHPEYLPIVRSLCEVGLSSGHGQYLIADICRTDLLVEIECIHISGCHFKQVEDREGPLPHTDSLCINTITT